MPSRAGILVALAAALLLSACGKDALKVSEGSPQYAGAELFSQRCAGCHTLKVAGTKGSASDVKTRERTDGPNFDARCETFERVLYAVRNGGFSGAIMPQNIVVGAEAKRVAEFVAKSSGREASNPPSSGSGQLSSGATPKGKQPAGKGSQSSPVCELSSGPGGG